VTTDQGLEGWGEAFGFRAVRSAKLTVEALVAPLRIGKAPTQIATLMLGVQKKLPIFGRTGPYVLWYLRGRYPPLGYCWQGYQCTGLPASGRCAADPDCDASLILNSTR
jgi:hypothetical protein